MRGVKSEKRRDNDIKEVKARTQLAMVELKMHDEGDGNEPKRPYISRQSESKTKTKQPRGGGTE